MSLLDTLDPEFRPFAQDLYDLAKRAGVHPHITSARRSYAKQNSLYQAWINGRSRYPAAPPGTSAHEYGLAFDMVVPSAIDEADLGTVWVSWGGVYGGKDDPVHFEAPGFSSKRAVPSASGPSADIPGIRQKARQIADLLAPVLLPPPLSSIIGIAGLAHAIELALGQYSDPLAAATWALSHPFEFFDRALSAIWASILYNIGF